VKAVILAGGLGTNLNPLTKRCPQIMLPIANRPLVDYLIDFLKRWGIRQVIFCINPQTRVVEDYLGDGRGYGLDVRYSLERKPRGTAGALLDIKDMLDEEPLLILNGNQIFKFDLKDLMRFHRERGSKLTILASIDGNGFLSKERLQVAKDCSLMKYVFRGYTGEFLPTPIGIYLINPEILELVEDTGGYLDIKEQLIPALQQKNVPIFTYFTTGFHRSVESLQDYLTLNWEILSKDLGYDSWGREIKDQVWVGKEVRIAQEARIIGPVVIGNNVSVERNCQIIGPAVIGDNCCLSEGSFLRESVLLPDSLLRAGSRVEYSLIGQGCEVPEKGTFRWRFVTGDRLKIGDLNLLPPNLRLEGISNTDVVPFLEKARFRIFRFLKRAIDIGISIIGLISSSPLFLLISLIIKLDSPGPVFFTQVRCGLWGKRFKIIKFRSMISGAEEIKNRIRHLNQVDGPLFKIKNDPRLTRVGRWLRKTSLDELPQLINVLKGDMSLVGPRPLSMEEMRFSPAWRDIRLRVKPGLTGLWQINGRSWTSFHDWIRHDINYVRNQSLWLDLKILLKTPIKILKGVGAE